MPADGVGGGGGGRGVGGVGEEGAGGRLDFGLVGGGEEGFDGGEVGELGGGGDFRVERCDHAAREVDAEERAHVRRQACREEAGAAADFEDVEGLVCGFSC